MISVPKEAKKIKKLLEQGNWTMAEKRAEKFLAVASKRRGVNLEPINDLLATARRERARHYLSSLENLLQELQNEPKVEKREVLEKFINVLSEDGEGEIKYLPTTDKSKALQFIAEGRKWLKRLYLMPKIEVIKAEMEFDPELALRHAFSLKAETEEELVGEVIQPLIIEIENLRRDLERKNDALETKEKMSFSEEVEIQASIPEAYGAIQETLVGASTTAGTTNLQRMVSAYMKRGEYSRAISYLLLRSLRHTEPEERIESIKRWMASQINIPDAFSLIKGDQAFVVITRSPVTIGGDSWRDHIFFYNLKRGIIKLSFDLRELTFYLSAQGNGVNVGSKSVREGEQLALRGKTKISIGKIEMQAQIVFVRSQVVLLLKTWSPSAGHGIYIIAPQGLEIGRGGHIFTSLSPQWRLVLDPCRLVYWLREGWEALRTPARMREPIAILPLKGERLSFAGEDILIDEK